MIFKNVFLIIFIFLSTIPNIYAESLPIIDGIADTAWDTGYSYEIPMTNGEFVSLTIIYTSTDIYFLAIMPHNSPEDTINRDTIGLHDYFGIEFDRNGDGVIMGTSPSKDDMIIVDYDKPGFQDMFMYDFKVYQDTEYGGTNDGEGASGEDNGSLVWEFRKALDSGDIAGNDISYKEGMEFYIMIAFWDDKATHTAATHTNTFQEGSQFLRFKVGAYDPKSNNNTIISTIAVILAGIITTEMTGKGFIIDKFKKFYLKI